MSFFNLPTELQTYIYQFDPTYHNKFKMVLEEISFINAHRYFYYNKNRDLCCYHITSKNIDMFLDEYYTSFSKEKKTFIKEYLKGDYNMRQVNLLGDNSDEIYFDIEKQYTFQKPITKIGTLWSDVYDIANIFI